MNDRFTEKARNAIEKARAAAMELGHSYIGTEHLLLGIVRETDALGSRVLRENGFEEDLVMDLIEKAAGRGAVVARCEAGENIRIDLVEIAAGGGQKVRGGALRLAQYAHEQMLRADIAVALSLIHI